MEKKNKKNKSGWKIGILLVIVTLMFLGAGIVIASFADDFVAEIEEYIVEVVDEGREASITADIEAQGELALEDLEVQKEISQGEEEFINDGEEVELDLDNEIEVTDPVGSGAIVTDVTDVVEKVMPSVVSINCRVVEEYLNPYDGDVYLDEYDSSGSGIIFGQDEEEILIVTNYHVIEDSEQVLVQFIDEKEVEAYVKGTDPKVDLAVLAILTSDIEASTLSEIAMARFGDSNELTVGEPAIAIGNALGYGQSVTTGVISALDRAVGDDRFGNYENLIQTDAAINPGNSGGALLNIKGEVIGINSNKIGGESIEGMGYAIPISKAIPIIEDLMQNETRIKIAEAERGYIGIQGVNMTEDLSDYYGIPEGVYISEVYEGSGAQAAGLKMGDVITGVNEKETLLMSDLQSELQYYAKGDVIVLTVQQENDGKYTETEVEVELMDASILTDE